jgi:hypothetical protein
MMPPMTRGRLVSTFVTVVVLAGCHAAPAPATSATPARAPAAAPKSAAAGEESWVVAIPIESNAEERIFAAGKDGSRKVIHGALRMVFRGDANDVAPDAFASPIANVFELGDSWYFVTSPGDIFKSASFLGRPVSVGAAVAPRSMFVETSGHTAFLADGYGAFWSFDGEKARRLDLAGASGGVWHASDGTPLVEICGRWYSLDAGGATTATRRPPAEDTGAGVDAEGVEQLRQRAKTAVASRARNLDSALLKVTDAAAMSSAAFPDASAAIRRAGGRCEIMAAGSQPIGICAPASGRSAAATDAGEAEGDADDESATRARAVFRLRANGTAEKWVDIKPREGAFFASSGPSLFLGEEYGHTWLHGGKRTRLEGIDWGGPCADPEIEPEYETVGLFGPRLLVLQTCIGRPPAQNFEVISLGEKSDRAPLSALVPKGATIVDAALSADHSTLSVTIADTSGRVSVARGTEPAKLTVHPLPPHAKAAAFVDPRRGIAVGVHLGQLWVTVDGAASWFPLAAPVAGDPASIPITRPPTCTMLSCSWGSEWSSIVWASPRALRETGFVQAPLVAPGRVAPDRPYPGLRPAHPLPVSFPDRADRGPKTSGCPAVAPSPPRAPKRRR